MLCQKPTCTDGVRNGNETDTDCGGPDCDPQGKTCPAGFDCLTQADCAGAAKCNGTTFTPASDCVGGTCVAGIQVLCAPGGLRVRFPRTAASSATPPPTARPLSTSARSTPAPTTAAARPSPTIPTPCPPGRLRATARRRSATAPDTSSPRTTPPTSPDRAAPSAPRTPSARAARSRRRTPSPRPAPIAPPTASLPRTSAGTRPTAPSPAPARVQHRGRLRERRRDLHQPPVPVAARLLSPDAVLPPAAAGRPPRDRATPAGFPVAPDQRLEVRPAGLLAERRAEVGRPGHSGPLDRSPERLAGEIDVPRPEGGGAAVAREGVVEQREVEAPAAQHLPAGEVLEVGEGERAPATEHVAEGPEAAARIVAVGLDPGGGDQQAEHVVGAEAAEALPEGGSRGRPRLGRLVSGRPGGRTRAARRGTRAGSRRRRPPRRCAAREGTGAGGPGRRARAPCSCTRRRRRSPGEATRGGSGACPSRGGRRPRPRASDRASAHRRSGGGPSSRCRRPPSLRSG